MADTGEGVDDDEKVSHLLECFYRADASRMGGSSLGHAIRQVDSRAARRWDFGQHQVEVVTAFGYPLSFYETSL